MLTFTDWLCVVGIMSLTGFLCWLGDSYLTKKSKNQQALKNKNDLKNQALAQTSDQISSLKNEKPEEQIISTKTGAKTASSFASSNISTTPNPAILSRSKPVRSIPHTHSFLPPVEVKKPGFFSKFSSQEHTDKQKSSNLARERLKNLGLGQSRNSQYARAQSVQ